MAAPAPLRVLLFGLSGDPPTGAGGHGGLVAAACRLRRPGPAPAGPLFDELWVLPVFRHPFAAKRGLHGAAYAERVALCEAGLPPFAAPSGVPLRVLNAERDAWLDAQPAPSTSGDGSAAAEEGKEVVVGTAAVVAFLRRAHPSAHFTLLLGADSYRDLCDRRWRESEALLSGCSFLVAPRHTMQGAAAPPPDLSAASDAALLPMPPPPAGGGGGGDCEAVPAVAVSSTAARAALAAGDDRAAAALMHPAVLALVRRRGLYGAAPEEGG